MSLFVLFSIFLSIYFFILFIFLFDTTTNSGLYSCKGTIFFLEKGFYSNNCIILAVKMANW